MWLLIVVKAQPRWKGRNVGRSGPKKMKAEVRDAAINVAVALPWNFARLLLGVERKARLLPGQPKP